MLLNGGYAMMTFDFSPLFRSSVGFDHVGSLIDAAMRTAETAETYPPYNIERTGEDSYRITLAVAGFAPEELNIETRENVLTVSGERKNVQEERITYLHRGIAGRAFERRFQLADHVEVVNAGLDNGLLQIELVRRVPEAMRPRKIQIGAGRGQDQGKDKAKVIEHDNNNKADKKVA
jgi:molecular chaperone IbpA